MNQYQNVLVVIDGDQDDQPALRRAVYLNQQMGGKGKITAFLAIYDFSYEMTTLISSEESRQMRDALITQRSEWIRHQARGYLAAGVNISIKVVWFHRPYEAIIKQVIEQDHDLVIKMARQYDRFESVIFTPTDWQLLRRCPSPIWMVNDQPWPVTGSALVAVNLSSDEPQHDALNQKLVRESQYLSKLVNHTPLYLAGAYPLPPVNIAIELPDYDPYVTNEAIRGQYLLAMKSLRQKFSIPCEMTHVEQGEPAEVLPALAKELTAGVVILGTLGRTGLSAAFLGNTAEQVINHLSCDVLVIKPDDFPTLATDNDPN